MSENETLNPAELEMIAVGASIAAGCQPCTAYHIKAARTAGTCESGMSMAVNAALEARRAATEAMSAWAVEQLGGAAEISKEWLAERKRIQTLISAAAAFAVNSVGQFQRWAGEARDAGASGRQIEAAVTIARKIRGVAAEKVEAAAPHSEPAPAPQSDCAPASAATGCGCSG